MTAPVAYGGGEQSTRDDLLRRLRRGDARAFDVLFEAHCQPLTRFVARMVQSPHVAAELVHDVFLRLWRGRASLAVRGDAGSYLRRAARNRALDWLRRECLHREWERTAVHETHASVETLGDESGSARRHELVARALAAMPERRHAVCRLRWCDGLGPSAIAQRLGVSLKTVESHITLGLKELRAAATAENVAGYGSSPLGP